MIIMKNSIKTTFAIIIILFLSSCGAVASSYDAPLEPGQTVFQKQGTNGTNNNQNIPEPGQNQMKQQNDDDDVPEPGQTEMKSKDDDDDNITEPGQTEMK